MSRIGHLSILIVDDQDEVLEVYEDVLANELGHTVYSVYSAAEAVNEVQKRLFDIVLVDAKIPYKGAQYGGLILAEGISTILGLEAVLLMSQHDVRDDVRALNKPYHFLPKPRGGDFLEWVKGVLLRRIQKQIERQYGFVVMPYGDEASDLWYRSTLAPWLRDAGFSVRRMDEIATTRPINTDLLSRIRDAHLVVVYASAANANVYYEAGYACALEKFTLVFTRCPEELPFDIRPNRALPVADSDEEKARLALQQFMRSLRGVG
ncbi:MAG: response regulator [Lentisphaeria bacterium]|nr:response regulator [Lentisphaeria bacterium]